MCQLYLACVFIFFFLLMSCFGLAMNDYAKINQLKGNNEENTRKRHKGKLSGGARDTKIGGGEKGNL